MPAHTDISQAVYSISQLNREARQILESGFPPLWVMGELSNFTRAASGHWYFTLKDAHAQVRCAMFRNRNQGLSLRPDNGLQVQIRAQVSLYENRGEFQLIADQMQPAGEGALRMAFEALKARLAAEGLFEASRKRPLPTHPHTIGVITSPTGAALRDILHVLNRRYPAARVVLYPVAVQGVDAAPQIIRALELAGVRREIDVLILARGGGSLEDLWAFNLEEVARAINAFPLPIVTGVGHEIDFTIADFVSDLRAPTPSAAAESVVPDGTDLMRRFRQSEARLAHLTHQRLDRDRLRIQQLSHRLGQCHPERRLEHQRQALDELESRLHRAMRYRLDRTTQRLTVQQARLWAERPLLRLRRGREQLQHLRQALDRSMAGRLAHQASQLANLSRALGSVSPLGTLERGYAIVKRLPDGAVVHAAAQACPGSQIQVHLHQGLLTCLVETSTDL